MTESLAGALADLPIDLEYRGEFGAEVVLFLPFMQWLSEAGHLETRRIVTYPGMKSFYDHMAVGEIAFRQDTRRAVPAARRPAWLPVTNEHQYLEGPHPQHRYPDLREKFLARPLPPTPGLLGKPLLIIHNKHNVEWGVQPFNFLSLEALGTIFEALKDQFSIVYIRHGRSGTQPGYTPDRNKEDFLGDGELLAKYPEVFDLDRLFDDFVDRTGVADLNDFKNRLYARCTRFITVQGGGAHHIALFSESVMGIFHRRGPEAGGAYKSGYYGFMARPAPTRMVVKDDLGIEKVIQAVRRSLAP